ncbi:hypothetical protein Gohar_027040 [Gossypium harknessii]|uniref:RNase H type-1 domain-containing protein n=1 Tax=Gossypium harknessii TaxID=34285 RepID=A0A7J9HW77_9ROSI|nr:hypothetical protein [Gossypium harknessii]
MKITSQASSSSTDNWIQLYSDGVVKVDSGGPLWGECYGIIRANKRLGMCLVFNAELWKTVDGLTILHIRIWDKVSIQTNSAKIIQAIQEAFSRSSNSALIRRIQQLLSIMVQWEMIHTPREENIEVDRIAKLAFNRDEGLQLFTENPLLIDSLI